MHSPTQLCGLKAEKIAMHFLKKQGLKLLVRNFRSPFGEIDLICTEFNTIIFIEVRYRRVSCYASSIETIDYRKQAKIIRTACYYLQKYPNSKACRFDVVAIDAIANKQEICWIKDAFQVQY